MRDANAPLHVIPVVSPDGLIKPIQVGEGITSEHVQPVFAPQQNRHEKRRLLGWDVTGDSKAAGWVTLEELYRREGKLKVWEVYKDYLAAMAQGRANTSFPESLLPREVLERRKNKAEGADQWRPPDGLLDESVHVPPVRGEKVDLGDASEGTAHIGDQRKPVVTSAESSRANEPKPDGRSRRP